MMELAEPDSSLGQTAGSAIDLFMAWILTPTGATLTILLLLMGVGSLVMRIMGRTGRILKACVSVTLGLLFLWIISGVLSAMGIPVREWVAQVGAWVPSLLQAIMSFIERLFRVAG